MSRAPAVPEPFQHLVDLATDATGAFVVYANDDYFAPKENLLKPSAPLWLEDEYTDRGKWMDGWESQRRREPGHDVCILRLGMPGNVHGLLVDTTHFKGNAPQAFALEGLEAADTLTAEALMAHPGWAPILGETAILPDHPNLVQLSAPSQRVTHVRFHIFPDGGVARLRVYGAVAPDPSLFWRPGSIDLVALQNGGTVAAASDQFFGPPSNLLLPGRGVNMGDGWETKRRRTPGSDFCVLRLARRGRIERIELDTHFFKGNAPQATLIEALDETTLAPGELEGRLLSREPWPVLVSRTPLVQHRNHVLEPDRPMAVTHVRVHIFPHGGVNRLRVFGHALDTASELDCLNRLHGLSQEEARVLALSWNGARQFAQKMSETRPFSSARALFARAEELWWSLSEADWLEAFAAHPRLGQSKAAPSQTAVSAAWSKGEQAGISSAEAAVKERLATQNEAYFQRFGFSFILFATGRSADDVLARLEERLQNSRAQELENAAREQAKITRLRIGKWLKGA